jgi:cell shape-determining protein MreD
VKLLRALLVLLAALVLQVGLSRLWPECHRFVNLLVVPVVWYGSAGSQRAAMLVGCLAGLLHDSWFEFPIGVYGFKWALIGWGLGVVALRIDLNHQTGLFLAGVVAWLADSLLDPGLRRLVDLEPLVRSPRDIVIHAIVTGLLAALAGSIVRRMGERDSPRRFA